MKNITTRLLVAAVAVVSILAAPIAMQGEDQLEVRCVDGGPTPLGFKGTPKCGGGSIRRPVSLLNTLQLKSSRAKRDLSDLETRCPGAKCHPEMPGSPISDEPNKPPGIGRPGKKKSATVFKGKQDLSELEARCPGAKCRPDMPGSPISDGPIKPPRNRQAQEEVSKRVERQTKPVRLGGGMRRRASRYQMWRQHSNLR